MIKFLLRAIFGLVFFEIGLAIAGLAVISTLIRSIFGGKKAVLKLFNKRTHRSRPETAIVGYDHDFVRTRSGVRFHYVQAGDPQKPLMLCVHGFPECWYSWKHVLKNFKDDYHVVAVDMRGYGDSDKPKTIGEYHIDYLVRDVNETIRALGYQSAVLVGHDWGSVIAWEVARFYPDVVSKLVTMNGPPPSVFRKFAPFHPAQFLRSWYMFFYQVPWLPEFLCSFDDYKPMTNFFRGRGSMRIRNQNNVLSDDEIEIYKNAACRNIKYGINYYRAANPIYTGLGLKPKSKKVTQPVILIWGSEDAALDVRLVAATKKLVTQLKTVVIEGASHWVQLDEPERVIDAMKEFLKD